MFIRFLYVSLDSFKNYKKQTKNKPKTNQEKFITEVIRSWTLLKFNVDLKNAFVHEKKNHILNLKKYLWKYYLDMPHYIYV